MVLLNGFFIAVEFTMANVRRSRLAELADERALCLKKIGLIKGSKVAGISRHKAKFRADY